jgi:lipopolysaccharide/colanic/teichoic acid biosynthesis glycosyltransferase
MTIARSDPQWGYPLRLDLSFVDNWSMAGDLLLIAKTLKPVVDIDRAY